MAGDICRNGLHERVEGALTCAPCKRIANRRYDTSEKGLAAHREAYARYALSTGGMLRRLRYHARRAGVTP